MPAELILSNARVVTADRVIDGTLVIRDGLIAALDEGRSQLPQAQDLDGDYLIPGLVELHTDNLEKHMTPRPGVDWPSASAVLTHDAQIVAAGITTVFDALSIGDINPRGKRMQQLPAMLDAIAKAEAAGDTGPTTGSTCAARFAIPMRCRCFATWWNIHWCNWCR